MLEIIGFMIAAYGVIRLALAADVLKLDPTGNRFLGTLGIIALVILAVLLSQQANQISGGLGL